MNNFSFLGIIAFWMECVNVQSQVSFWSCDKATQYTAGSLGARLINWASSSQECSCAGEKQQSEKVKRGKGSKAQLHMDRRTTLWGPRRRWSHPLTHLPSHANFHSGPSPHQSIDSSGDVELSRQSWQIIMLLTDSCTDITQVLSPQRDSSNSYTQTKRLS